MFCKVCFRFSDGREEVYAERAYLQYWTIRQWHALYTALADKSLHDFPTLVIIPNTGRCF